MYSIRSGFQVNWIPGIFFWDGQFYCSTNILCDLARSTEASSWIRNLNTRFRKILDPNEIVYVMPDSVWNVLIHRPAFILTSYSAELEIDLTLWLGCSNILPCAEIHFPTVCSRTLREFWLFNLSQEICSNFRMTVYCLKSRDVIYFWESQIRAAKKWIAEVNFVSY